MYVLIGKIITTHGLRGEVKIRSDFDRKDLIFQVGSKLYLGSTKEEVTVLFYRVHQDYDMVTLTKIDSLEKAISYKQQDVFIKKEDLDTSLVLDVDYLSSKVYFASTYLGEVTEITDFGGNNKVFVINGNKRILIPKNEHFIASFDKDNKKLILKNVEGLL